MSTLLKGLYAITQASKSDSRQLFSDVEAALKGGASMVQYRDKSRNNKLRRDVTEYLYALCASFSVPLIINDDVDLAKTIGAAGVHLGKDDTDLLAARKELGDQAIIGVSCYNSLRLAEEAEAAGADYIAFGSFFDSPSKPEAVKADLSLLQSWRHHKTPVCAIGGITVENATELISAGADMLAVISSLWAADDIEQQAWMFSRLFEKTKL
ncbi:MAG TPA: thiamine phosphate synthase [Chromatiales bacterium]|nr:thiamine phosphate synthase [Thiotrichales bacterium]HIP66996.1 thiamine phosphate synthase [Chromatiales bacterium]